MWVGLRRADKGNRVDVIGVSVEGLVLREFVAGLSLPSNKRLVAGDGRNQVVRWGNNSLDLFTVQVTRRRSACQKGDMEHGK
jgi:hypothetical protein